MTYLALTVSPDFVVMSQDSAGADTLGRPEQPAPSSAESYEDAYRDFWLDDADGPEPVAPEIIVPKIYPVGSIAIGGIGAMLAAPALATELKNVGMENFDDASAHANNCLFALLIAFDIGPSHVFMVGHSERLGRPAGFVYSAPYYRPVPLQPGHMLHPLPCDSVDGYSAILDAWEPPAAGTGTAAFHRLVFDNVVAGWRKRRLRRWSTFGGPLHTVVVTAAGLNFNAAAE